MSAAAALAAAAALGGVILGHLLNRSAEYRRWLRSERIVACVTFLQSVQAVSLEWQMHANMRKLVTEIADSVPPEELRARAEQHLSGLPGLDHLDATGRARMVDEAVRHATERSRQSAVHEATQLLWPDSAAWLSRQHDLAYKMAAAHYSLGLICPSNVVNASGRLLALVVTLRDDKTYNDLESWLKGYNKAIADFLQAARRPFIGSVWLRIRSERVESAGNFMDEGAIITIGDTFGRKRRNR